jgi:hypothetical protein
MYRRTRTFVSHLNANLRKRNGAENFKICTHLRHFKETNDWLFSSTKHCLISYGTQVVNELMSLDPTIASQIKAFSNRDALVVFRTGNSNFATLAVGSEFDPIDQATHAFPTMQQWYEKVTTQPHRTCALCAEHVPDDDGFTCPHCVATVHLHCFARITRASLNSPKHQLPTFVCPACHSQEDAGSRCFLAMPWLGLARVAPQPSLEDAARVALADNPNKRLDVLVQYFDEQSMGCMQVFGETWMDESTNDVKFHVSRPDLLQALLKQEGATVAIGDASKVGGESSRAAGRAYQVDRNRRLREIARGFEITVACYWHVRGGANPMRTTG